MDRKVKNDRFVLQNPYAHLQPDGAFEAAPHDTGFVDKSASSGEGNSIIKTGNYSRDRVRALVRELHRSRWLDEAGSSDSDQQRVRLALDPGKAAETLGFSVEYVPTLSVRHLNRNRSTIAGIIDPDSSSIFIAEDQPAPTRAFTLAHEVGHAVLHPSIGLHRDRPVEFAAGRRQKIEKEADWFAVEFLMPAKLVTSEFRQRFTELELRDMDLVKHELKINVGSESMSRRDLALCLASATCFCGRRFATMTEIFQVSAMAMAIRLEELSLV